MSNIPICECAAMWPGKGHHPECPVRQEIERLSDAESRLINLTEALLERAEKVGAVYLWHIKSLIAEALAPASTHPCLVDDTKKGSGQKDQHLSASEGDSGQSGQRTDKPCWNCGQHKEICICDTL